MADMKCPLCDGGNKFPACAAGASPDGRFQSNCEVDDYLECKRLAEIICALAPCSDRNKATRDYFLFAEKIKEEKYDC